MKQAGQCGVTLLFFRNVFKWLWIRTCRYQYVDTLSCRHTSLATAGRTIASEHHRGCAMVRPQWQALYRQFAHPPSPTRMGVLRNAFALRRWEICVTRARLCWFWTPWLAHSTAVVLTTAHSNHPLHCANLQADVYVAFMLVTEQGYAKDCSLLQKCAKEHHLMVIMANFCGVSGGWEAMGEKAVLGPSRDWVLARAEAITDMCDEVWLFNYYW